MWKMVEKCIIVVGSLSLHRLRPLVLHSCRQQDQQEGFQRLASTIASALVQRTKSNGIVPVAFAPQ